MNTTRFVQASAITMLLALGTACAGPAEGGGDSSAPAAEKPSLSKVQEIADMVPEDIAEQGTLKIGATSTNLPAQFTDDSGNLQGVAIDMYGAAADVMGLEADFQVVTFDALQPGVESGRYDLATMGVNPERLEQFDIISLYSNGISVVTNKSVEDEIADFKTDLCGKAVAVTKGTLIDREVSKASEECVANGKEAMAVSSYVDNAGVALAVTSGQEEAGVLETVVALAYANRDADRLNAFVGESFSSSGPGINKGNDELVEAFRAALLHLVETGYYEEVMTKYGVQDMMVPDMPLNDSPES